MADSALVLGITGIVVSGIVGPTVSYRYGRAAQKDGFKQDAAVRRRADLQGVLDQAALLLASGATMLRILKEPATDPAQTQAAMDWMSQIYPIGQRLQLWLPSDDPVVVSYEEVRELLVQMARVKASPEKEFEAAIEKFEGARRSFLDNSRAALIVKP